LTHTKLNFLALAHLHQLLDEAAERRAQKLAIAIQRENEREALRVAAAAAAAAAAAEESAKEEGQSNEGTSGASDEMATGEPVEGEESGSSRKRRRAQVDYLALDKKLSEATTAVGGDIAEEV